MRKVLYGVGVVFCSIASSAAVAQDGARAPEGGGRNNLRTSQNSSGDTVGIQEIVVTANKRAQSINSVGMSITAATGEALAQRGIIDTADLVKVVPGFTVAKTQYGPPVYTLRGIGFYEQGIGSPPAVSIYVDEVVLAFPVMTQGASLDLERVEVLKGPQGLLFGQNSTGGAINYIAAKPTTELKMGADLSFSRFNQVDASGFISGPLSSNLRGRIAMRTSQGGAWQYSNSRPNDRLGSNESYAGRILLDWDATPGLTFRLNVNGFIDKSDTQAPQLVAIQPAVPTAPSAALQLAFQPFGEGNNRVGEWTTDWPNRHDDSFWQAALRGDYEIGDSVKLTSITSYQRMKVDTATPNSGFPIRVLDDRQTGTIRSVNQELRLSGSSSRLTWLIGGNYEHVNSKEITYYRFPLLTISASPLPGILPDLGYDNGSDQSQKIKDYALFANGEFKLTDNLAVQAGARYTNYKVNGSNCNRDFGPTYPSTALFNFLQSILNSGPVPPIQNGSCFELDSPQHPVAVGAYEAKLNQENVAWRLGLNYKFNTGGIVYATYSRGWKAGAFTNITSAYNSQFAPAVQERVDAYEVGAKLPLFDRRIQFNSAAFYYGYKNKQTRTRVLDPIFGLLDTLQNIPKSRVYGVEADLAAKPFPGLSLSLSGIYLNTKITGDYITISQDGVGGNFKGSKLTFSPKWTGLADAQYETAFDASHKLFVGGSLSTRSSQNSTFATAAVPAPNFKIDGYTLLDLRAGFAASDDEWRVTLFARNVTNKYYINNVISTTDGRYKLTGRPATYGVSVSVRPNF